MIYILERKRDRERERESERFVNAISTNTHLRLNIPTHTTLLLNLNQVLIEFTKRNLSQKSIFYFRECCVRVCI